MNSFENANRTQSFLSHLSGSRHVHLPTASLHLSGCVTAKYLSTALLLHIPSRQLRCSLRASYGPSELHTATASGTAGQTISSWGGKGILQWFYAKHTPLSALFVLLPGARIQHPWQYVSSPCPRPASTFSLDVLILGGTMQLGN